MMNDQQLRKLEQAARSRAGDALIEFLNFKLREWADIRNLPKQDERSIVVRMEAIEMVDTEVIKKLKLLAGHIDAPDEDEFR